MLLGAVGLVTLLLSQKLIEQHIYDDFMTIIHADEQQQLTNIQQFVAQFQLPVHPKRGRKKINIQIIVENLPTILSEQQIEEQEDRLNFIFMNKFFIFKP